MSGAPVSLYSATTIAERVHALGAAIRAHFGAEPVTLLGVLKGAALFVADLARAVGEPAALTFVRAGSYGAGTKSSGDVSLEGWDEADLKGRSVLVADTILDTGHTLRAVVAAVTALGAAEVKSCVLFDKRPARQVAIEADWVGFDVPDRFLVGYGLDHAGRYRTLGYVGALDE